MPRGKTFRDYNQELVFNVKVQLMETSYQKKKYLVYLNIKNENVEYDILKMCD